MGTPSRHAMADPDTVLRRGSRQGHNGAKQRVGTKRPAVQSCGPCPTARPPRPHPYTSALLRIWGSMLGGMPNSASVGSCQLRLPKSRRLVRLALDTSVRCTPPPAAPPAGEGEERVGQGRGVPTSAVLCRSVPCSPRHCAPPPAVLPPTCQLVEQPGVDGAEAGAAVGRGGRHRRHMLHQPLELVSREVSGNGQPRDWGRAVREGRQRAGCQLRRRDKG